MSDGIQLAPISDELHAAIDRERSAAYGAGASAAWEQASAKLVPALKCLRSIAEHGRHLPSDGLAKECLRDIGEPIKLPENG